MGLIDPLFGLMVNSLGYDGDGEMVSALANHCQAIGAAGLSI